MENAKPEPAAEPVKKLTVEQTCMEMIRQLLAIADHAKNKKTAAQDFVQRASGVLMVAEGLRR